ncbi:Dynein assembly factor with WDR repeat domains 1 [Borealophlyctis nickersoniae]|nr:Dynein assembly factor with WDR repeat domains 1 [Borealophlyctis nickersoniae]
MKLKRMLLRYYPPGVILEYEQGGTVKSKTIDILDLRPTSNVSSLAEEIIASEPLLSASRIKTVETLLSRLKQKLESDTPRQYVLFKKLEAHVMPLTNCAFNKSGDRFITGSYDRLCKLWDTMKGTELLSLEGHKNVVYALAFNNPFGDKIATGSFDKTAKLWSAETGKCHHTFKGHNGEIVCLAFNPQSSILATGSMDNTSMLWDVRTGNDICKFKGHSGEVISLGFNTAGDLLLTGSFDSTVNVWDVRSGKAEISNVLFDYPGNRILSGSMDGTAKVWDVITGKCLATLRYMINNDPPPPICYRKNILTIAYVILEVIQMKC